ncbi:MAG TPA: cytochrome c [Symbiobacteriaceae bacterium]|jgi:disulfide bond formation protein DsbB
MSASKWVSLIAAGALVAVLAGCGGGGGAAAPVSKGDVAKGKEVFNGTCIACHGADAKGLAGLGKNLVVKTDWMKKQDDAALLAFVKTGRPASDPLNTTKVDMPPKGGNPALSDDDITNAISYIRSLQAAAK